MKLYAAGLPGLLTQIKSLKVKAVMLYGPDKGLISYCTGSIAKELGAQTRVINYKEAQSSGLDIILNNATLFGGKEIVKITEVPPSIDIAFKKLLLAGTHHIPLLIADELTPSSSLRKLFESEEDMAAVSCYPDDENSLRKLVTSALSQNDKSIDPDAMRYLTHHISGDRYLSINELEKLILFTHDQKVITLENVRQCISAGITTSPDILCTSFATGKARGYLAESAKLLAENTSLVWIIRALTKYYINLYIVANLTERGTSLEEAMRTLKPQIFFKYVEDFKVAVRKNNKQKIITILTLLQQAEADSKSSVISAQNICERLFFEVQ